MGKSFRYDKERVDKEKKRSKERRDMRKHSRAFTEMQSMDEFFLEESDLENTRYPNKASHKNKRG